MPVWGAVLSDPLPIVGTVVRCTAVYLMGRMPIPDRTESFPIPAMQLGFLWGINPPFGGLSPCPGQVAYALRTRAPVAGGRIAAAPLPLDLHVLGLSLAFILSQDQTLRCMTFFVFCIFRAPGRRLSPRGSVAGLMLLVRLVSQYVNVRFAVFFVGRFR